MSGPREPAPTLGVVVPTLDEEGAIGELVARLVGDPARADAAMADADPTVPAPIAPAPIAPARADAADEVVVVDGGSCDRTVQRARAAGARVVTAPRGRGSQLAHGAALLETDLLLFLHADTRPAPGALAAVRRAFADPAVVATAMRQEIEAPGLFYRGVERAAALRVRTRGLVLGDSGLAVRSVAYRSAGGFRPLPVFEDWDLSRRIRRVGRVRFLPDAVLCVSARRWKRDGPLRRTALNWILSCGYLAGVPPERLARRYPPLRPHRRSPESPQKSRPESRPESPAKSRSDP